jgi:hypothetical protein
MALSKEGNTHLHSRADCTLLTSRPRERVVGGNGRKPECRTQAIEQEITGHQPPYSPTKFPTDWVITWGEDRACILDDDSNRSHLAEGVMVFETIGNTL